MNLRSLGLGAWLALSALLGLVLIALAGLSDMGFFSSDKRDLQRLLGEANSVLVEGADVVAWQPDPDHKPRAYYAVRTVAEPEFLRLAAQLKLDMTPSPAHEEAIWKLPPGLQVPGWAASASGSTLQAQRALGSANAWLRWQGGTLFLVVLRAS